MVMKGIGIDIIKINRFRRIPYKKRPSFYKNIFTNLEIEYCLGKKDPYPSFAARFAAKEAIVKAVGGTIYKARQIEIRKGSSGRPMVKLQGRKKILLSLSHDGEYAAAIALWLN
ncbi:MAG: holo-ACP synthase [Candidatus Harrisonbacteria bacterium]|nr:holo-ACP synthase [Candidatus Harrisonbacteria bacterium]